MKRMMAAVLAATACASTLSVQAQNTESAPPSLTLDEALAAAKAGDYETALAMWEPLARAGNPRAQNNIGACFAEGLGVPTDRPLALKWR